MGAISFKPITSSLQLEVLMHVRSLRIIKSKTHALWSGWTMLIVTEFFMVVVIHAFRPELYIHQKSYRKKLT
jgi:hypothetical protein